MTDEKSELLSKPYWFYIKKNKRTVSLGILWLFLTNLMETIIPVLVGKTLDAITASAPLASIGEIVTWIFALLVVQSVFRYLWRVYWASFHHTVAEDLRNRVFECMMELGPSFFRPRKIGQLITLITNDVNSFRMGIGPGFLILLDGIMMAGLMLPVMISMSWTWTWQTLALMPLVPFAVKRLLSHLQVEFQKRQDRFSDMSGSAQEIVSGIRVIKSFAQEENQTRKFNLQSYEFMKSCDHVARWNSFFSPCLELPVALGSVVLLLLGVPEVIAGRVSIGQFFAFYQYIQRMIWPMEALGVALGHLQEGWASFARIREILDFKTDVPDSGEIEISEFVSLEARDLSFTYPGATEPTLKNISFVLKRGESLGVIGLTGSGKSTLLELLTRQYPVTQGHLLVNGIPVSEIKLSCLRKLIAIAPQDAFLFSRKVADNLALGLNQWNMDELREVASQVRLDQEIEKWPGAYEALVGERGVNLSGGQKQRMTLARAMVCQAPVVILDDALSAVDAKTEEDILANLRDEMQGTTSIIVSHRLASVRDANEIMVLKDGQIEAKGRHEDLIELSATYRFLHEMQMEGRR